MTYERRHENSHSRSDRSLPPDRHTLIETRFVEGPRPGHWGADESPPTRLPDDEIRGDNVKLPGEDPRRIYARLDGNAPFCGAYSQGEQDAQPAGEVVPCPGLQ